MTRLRKIIWTTSGLAALQVALSWNRSVYDDAYITFRYARNLARGLGPVYNAGDRVEGCTAFLQMALLAPFARLGVDLRLAAAVIAFACLTAVAAAGARFIIRAEAAAGEPTAWPWFFALMLVACPPTVYYALSGLETIWFAAAAFAALLLAAGEAEADRPPLASALAATVAALLRPDGVVLAGAIGVFWLTCAPRRRLARAAVFGAAFAVLYGAYFAWRYSYYGWLLPNTYYAKVDGISLRLTLRGLLYVARSTPSMLFPAVLVWLLAQTLHRRLPLALWEKAFLLAIGAQVALAAATGGDYMPYYRFLQPAWPLCLLLIWGLSRKLAADVSPGGRMARWWRLRLSVGGVVALALAVNILLWLADFNGLKAMIASSLTRSWERTAEQLKPLLPRDAVVAADAIGAAGYIGDLPLIDIMGLTDATIAHLPIATGKGMAGHEKYSPDYILSRAPDFILTCTMEWPRPAPACLGPRAETDTMRLAPRVREQYVYANHAIPGGYVGTYLRRDRLGRAGYDGWFASYQTIGLEDLAPTDHDFKGFLRYSPNGPAGH